MDKVIIDKRWIKPKHYKFIAGGVFLLVVAVYMIFRDKARVYKTEKDKLTIETVTKGTFNDYIKVSGQVEPISTVYLDAIEGGRVEEILIEEGSMVKKGDIILRLSNNNLNLNILESEANLAEKSNFLRETSIKMEQQKLDLDRSLLEIEFELTTKNRAYEQNKVLYKEKLISREEYLRAEEAYQLAKHSKDMMRERKRQDSLFRSVQVEQLKQSLGNMQNNLRFVNERLSNLYIKAPVEGQLGMLDAEIGQTISPGKRLGSVNVLTNFKLEARIDEHYIDRVKSGLTATLERQTDTLPLRIRKVYPEVREGQFKIDLVFSLKSPDNLRIGQTYYISLQLGEPAIALLVPRGGFFQSTGGQYIYVLDPTGKFAIKRAIKLGRQNPQFYEILDGLEPGEKVVTSGYDNFGDNEKIIF